ncbi:hypothetical protein VTL71DRAFT_13674 [Oculimacula yallundae]|uniref:Uncharacterized protein n=1 Tax=Oculimacula yallundae TaxID=86028 RepID=A0ABR4CL55_9HELO
MSDARPATRRGGCTMHPSTFASFSCVLFIQIASALTIQPVSGEAISDLMLEYHEDRRQLADYQARREILQTRVRHERELYDLHQQLDYVNRLPDSWAGFRGHHRVAQGVQVPPRTTPTTLAIIPGDGIRAFLMRIPGIKAGNLEEALRTFDEVMRGWFCRRFGWVDSVVLEDVLMEELDGALRWNLL